MAYTWSWLSFRLKLRVRLRVRVGVSLARKGTGFRSVVVITFALHAKGPRFDPGTKYILIHTQ